MENGDEDRCRVAAAPSALARRAPLGLYDSKYESQDANIKMMFERDEEEVQRRNVELLLEVVPVKLNLKNVKTDPNRSVVRNAPFMVFRHSLLPLPLE